MMGEWIVYRASDRWWNSHQNVSRHFCKSRDYLEGQYFTCVWNKQHIEKGEVVFKYFHCYTVHVVESLNYYTN